MASRRTHWTRVARELRIRFGLSWRDAIQAYRYFRDSLVRYGEKPSIRAVRRHPRLAKRAAQRAKRYDLAERSYGAVKRVRGEWVLPGFPRTYITEPAYAEIDSMDLWKLRLSFTRSPRNAYLHILRQIIEDIDERQPFLARVQERLFEMNIPAENQITLAYLMIAAWRNIQETGRVTYAIKAAVRDYVVSLGMTDSDYFGLLKSLY